MKQIGSLKCIDLGSSSPDDTLVILFHGFGADAFDLQTLSDVIETPWPAHWIFPQGHLEVPIGPGWTGRAWWNIDMQALNESMMRGEVRDLSNTVPEGLALARQKAFSMIEALKTPWNKIVLGGFSQGAMLATDLYLQAPETPKGLIIFSGALLNKTEWRAKAANRAGQSFFLSHGKNDMVLAHKGAQQLETLLTQSGMKGKLQSFPGAHEIPPETIAQATQYLRSL